MWISRDSALDSLKKRLLELERQVLLVQGARQVGKTTLIRRAFDELDEYPQLLINLLYPSSFILDGKEYFGRDFFGRSPQGEEFLNNIEQQLGPLSSMEKPVLVFIDEVDRYPLVMESIQTLAEFSSKLKCVFSGSGLENLPLENAATGRKSYFDLYPLSFLEFLNATNESVVSRYITSLSVLEPKRSELNHRRATESYQTYLRVGGMPRIVSQYLKAPRDSIKLAQEMRDLSVSIEENVKLILGDKAKLYEYEDVLRQLCRLSLNTLKLTQLQVQHAGRAEAKRLVAKTVGARVAHKIRLWESDRDLSKYVLLDPGIANYLLAGSQLLQNRWSERDVAIIHETAVATSLVNQVLTREDLFYWKSGNRAEVEFMLRSPQFVGIDVKASTGSVRSLNSMALNEPTLEALVKISNNELSFNPVHVAKLSHTDKQRPIRLLNIPHYAVDRLLAFVDEVVD